MKQALHKSVTGQAIREILGPVDDDVVIDIMRIGASASEVLQAFEWLNDDDYMGAELRKPMNDNIQRVFDVLQKDRDRFGPDER